MKAPTRRFFTRTPEYVTVYSHMAFSRDITIKIQFLLDECLPPIIRDSSWLMKPLLKLFYKQHAFHYITFKERAPDMTEKDMAEFYATVANAPPVRDTDLASASVDAILRETHGPKVLEVGAGKCFLADKLSTLHHVTAADIFFDDALRTAHPKLTFVQTPIEKLPFEDRSFDTVVCANTLEHLLNIPVAVAELRRVAKNSLIIVMPRQRPYHYSFDAHLHFFPYRFSIMLALAPPKDRRVKCSLVGGDWFYVEEIPSA